MENKILALNKKVKSLIAESKKVKLSSLENKLLKENKNLKVKLSASKEYNDNCKAKNKKVEAKNSALSKKCEEFRLKIYVMETNIYNLKLKQQTKVKVVVELLLDGVLNLTEQEIADKLFVDIAYINNMKSTVRRERK
jgi:hypothetical protein